ncbi:hAT transposon superfamily protein [Striga hermonthica]|uniref:HAT transposon superfamily protein n=1 Tax=Striga hermonthica TaxID=68872 RepID=A0A9N7MYR5_STRHE|nr:hAT transposon superfamily protein [Striga hermonthica]
MASSSASKSTPCDSRTSTEAENDSQVFKRKSDDIGWNYGVLADPYNKDRVKCVLCSKVMSGGIRRLKEHIGQISGNVVSCKKATKEDQAKCRNAINESKAKKMKTKEVQEELLSSVNIKGLNVESSQQCEKAKESHSLGPMDRFATTINPEASLNVAKTMREQNINDAIWKERSNLVKDYFVDWAYEAGISFNATELDSFRLFSEALGQFGPRWKPPSSYEMREPLLKKAVERTKLKVKPHEDEWKKSGCSIMTDAWSDRKRRSIMNLCVNSKMGTIFLSSKESSDVSHTSEMIFEYVDQCIEQVGPENVVQVVTDNASNNMGAAKLLRIKRPTIFWTSCAAHTINLILEGIAKLPRFTKTIEQAKALTIFIYAHHKTLSMMRSYTKRRDIVRPGVTRFASSFLSLQSLMEKKAQLRAMFTSSEWDECKWSKTVKGKASYNTVMSISFWNGVTSFLTIFAPLVKVLRIADADKKPSMGFLYGELMHAKEDIKRVLNNLAKNYDPILEIIDTKMMGRLDTPLHLMAYLLNPYYHYKDPNLILDQVVSDGVLDCLDVICHGNFDLMDKIMNVELPIYKTKGGVFGKPIAAKGCEVDDEKFDPVYVQFNSRLLNKRKWRKEKDVLLASEASKAQEWIIPGLEDEDDEDVNGLEV